ncbi:unnamed protein product [Brassica rapa subsp. trilocularis]
MTTFNSIRWWSCLCALVFGSSEACLISAIFGVITFPAQDDYY